MSWHGMSHHQLMPPFPLGLTLAKPKSWFQKTWRSQTSTLSRFESGWQTMWHGFKVEVLSLNHRPSLPSGIWTRGKNVARTFEIVASCPCDWLHLVLAMRA